MQGGMGKPTWCTIPTLCVYFYSLHVSGNYVPIIGRNNCINTTPGICHSVWRLEVGYRATKVFDYGWIEYFGGQGLYWVLFNLGRVNQWFQYNNLKKFLGFFVM
jgi:hypothetical protein